MSFFSSGVTGSLGVMSPTRFETLGARSINLTCLSTPQAYTTTRGSKHSVRKVSTLPVSQPLKPTQPHEVRNTQCGGTTQFNVSSSKTLTRGSKHSVRVGRHNLPM